MLLYIYIYILYIYIYIYIHIIYIHIIYIVSSYAEMFCSMYVYACVYVCVYVSAWYLLAVVFECFVLCMCMSVIHIIYIEYHHMQKWVDSSKFMRDSCICISLCVYIYIFVFIRIYERFVYVHLSVCIHIHICVHQDLCEIRQEFCRSFFSHQIELNWSNQGNSCVFPGNFLCAKSCDIDHFFRNCSIYSHLQNSWRPKKRLSTVCNKSLLLQSR